MDPFESFEIDGLTVTIYPDEDPQSPREWDNLFTMRCWHRNYNLGDEPYPRGDYNHEDFLLSLASDVGEGDSFEKLQDKYDRLWLERGDFKMSKEDSRSLARDRASALWAIITKHYLIEPLALLDHSGLHIWIGSRPHITDSAGWDSGQVGWIYATKKKLLKEYDVKRWSKSLESRARKCMKAEVETYDQLLTGDVWGYKIEDPSGKKLDSCWGFFGLDYCKKEALAVATHLAAKHGVTPTLERETMGANASD